MRVSPRCCQRHGVSSGHTIVEVEDVPEEDPDEALEDAPEVSGEGGAEVGGPPMINSPPAVTRTWAPLSITRVLTSGAQPAAAARQTMVCISTAKRRFSEDMGVVAQETR